MNFLDPDMLVPSNTPRQLVEKFHTPVSAHPHMGDYQLKTHCKIFLGYMERKSLNESHQLVRKASRCLGGSSALGIAGDPIARGGCPHTETRKM